ncbi:MAG: Oxidoreductase molybdopterin binding domain protein [Methanoregulaceae archaeon PtaU1.Bin059]|nr:MAG: Oxidoreductase molybdopterin binding domain protein [Methanoregulaceae archaeon PtaB.Bin152]OPY36833.1 MAG: Oxidoreductase molybdopterin binding domain protein [Methanoregulaceae archaeon PtaU1.Bin059]
MIQTLQAGLILLVLFCCSTGCISQAPVSPSPDVTVPAEDYRSWTLTVNGTTQQVYSLADLRALPAATGHGFAVSTVGIKYGPYLCKGVLLTDLLERAGGISNGDQVWISAPDGYLWVFDYDQVQGNGFITFNENLKEIPSPPLRILLMYDMDGAPLSYNEGAPLRVAIISEEQGVVTEGSAWVKWVDNIEIRRKSQ